MADWCAIFLVRADGRLFWGTERFREIVALYHYFTDRYLLASCGVADGFLPDESDVDDGFHLLSHHLDIDGYGGLYRHSSTTEKDFTKKYALDGGRRIKRRKKAAPLWEQPYFLCC